MRTAAAAALLVACAAAQHREPLAGQWTIAPARADGTRPEAGAFGAARVPGTFEADLGIAFDGVAWYRRALALDPAWRGRHVRVVFHGAATDARVFLNGTQVGAHVGAWTPFRCELDAAIDWDGPNLLEVRVDEKVGHHTQGFLPIVQPHFGGLWQDVELCVDTGPVIDRIGLLAFADLAAGAVRVDAAVLSARGGTAASLRAVVRDGDDEVARVEAPIRDGRVAASVAVPSPRSWSPSAPALYTLALDLVAADGAVLDALERRVGFRSLEAHGRRLAWNGAPLPVRGVLHWGFAPPSFAPNPGEAAWRRELDTAKALGFNLVKCCLWVPPRRFYELCDEVGLLVWQEYPTWHAELTAANREELGREYDEFFRHDRSHACVALRSLTCETGHGADLALLRDLYARTHELVPNTLVIDDSSWISWSRVGDFWDDHPYGNNSTWPSRLAALDAFVREHGAKPLLLGECIASDTWFDAAALRARAEPAWWAPLCADDQRRFEAWFEARFGAAARQALLADSVRGALRDRKFQIERLRQDVPDAGYVVSVIRDFPKARMGLIDDLDRPKHTADEWAWHRETMLCLYGDERAFAGDAIDVAVRVCHGGALPLHDHVELALDAGDGDERGQRLAPLELAPGAVGPAQRARFSARVDAPRRVTLRARLASGGAHNAWELWLLPPPPAAAADDGVRAVDALDAATLAFLEQGGRVLLRASGRRHSLRTQELWFLRGKSFAPPHALAKMLPPALLQDLQTFDLEQPFVLDWEGLGDGVDPILAFWDTHDLAEVRRHLLVFEARVGAGRLLATALRDDTAAGRYVAACLRAHLATGPAPRSSLADDVVARLRAELAADTVDLVTWRFRRDPDDRGLAAGWSAGFGDDASQPLRAGAHWENQGVEHYDGVAWYATELDVPETWQGRTVRAVFEGVDDSFRVWVNGEEAGSFGDPAKGTTVWLQRVVADLTPHVRAGARNTIVLRVVDHGGAGGLWKPVFVTTGPVDGRGLLN